MQYAPAPPPQEEKSHGCLYGWYAPIVSIHSFVGGKRPTDFLDLQYRDALLLLAVRRDVRVLPRVPHMLLLDGSPPYTRAPTTTHHQGKQNSTIGTPDYAPTACPTTISRHWTLD